jgi:glycogen debranching enzyme GlgX
MDTKLPTFETFGPLLRDRKLIFSLFSNSAKVVKIILFHPHKSLPLDILPLHKRAPGIWTVEMAPLSLETQYLFDVDGHLALDPYAKSLSTPNTWGVWHDSPRGCLTFDHTFDWEKTKKPNLLKQDLIIYEMHVRGFTKHRSSKVSYPGTYLGIVEKIPYLKSLGINAIELLPIHEFDERDNPRKDPFTGKRLWNSWGYMTTNFFCPMKRYASSNDRLAALTEFKTMVRECHKNGIEVILDVVYNHASPASGLDLIDKESYFILNKDKSHTNFSGCGYTLSANSLATSHLILSSLHYFARECMVDGFRFDLGGCFARAKDGSILTNPPFFELLTKDPILADCKLIIEPWECFGLNLLNGFNLKNCSAWNSSFKAAMRRFVKSDSMQEQFFKDSFLGSKYLFPENSPTTKSINYVTCHDGFSLNDLVSYNQKHNQNNGENNRDGESDNSSYNFGIEGATKNETIVSIRTTQMKNLLFVNLLAIGIPMIRMGDEYGHTNFGNNNTYCQDELGWFQWDKTSEIFPFLQSLIALRKKTPLYRTDKYFTEEEASPVIMRPNSVALLLKNSYLIVCNASHEPLLLPSYETTHWKILLSTNKEASFTPSLLIPPRSFLIACRH